MASQQQPQNAETLKDKIITLEGLPLTDSPYVQHENVEDYKLSAYPQGQLPAKPAQGGGGATGAPTLSGGSGLPKAQAPA